MIKKPFLCGGCKMSYLRKEEAFNCESRHLEGKRKEKAEDVKNSEGGNPW